MGIGRWGQELKWDFSVFTFYTILDVEMWRYGNKTRALLGLRCSGQTRVCGRGVFPPLCCMETLFRGLCLFLRTLLLSWERENYSCPVIGTMGRNESYKENTLPSVNMVASEKWDCKCVWGHHVQCYSSVLFNYVQWKILLLSSSLSSSSSF